MHSNSNPQGPARTTANPADPSEVTTASTGPSTAKAEPSTARRTPAKATPAKAKQTPRVKQASKAPRQTRRATNPTNVKTATKDRPTAKPAEKLSSAPAASTKAPREGSTMWAILKVLGEATEPLTAKAIYAQITERKLAPGLKGKTPDQTIAAKLAVAAKKGEYVERAAPGRFQLLKDRS